MATASSRAGNGESEVESPVADPTEFLIVSLPEAAKVGAGMRLLGAAKTQKQAEEQVAGLDPGTLGRVAILKRVGLYDRRPAVESIVIDDPLLSD